MDTSGQPPTPAGWYPDPQGQAAQRYWDGSQWTDHTSDVPTAAATGGAAISATSDTGMAQLTHILGLLTGFVGPLILWLVKKDDPFVEQHSKEALNFQITIVIAFIVAGVLSFVLIGLLLLPVIFIVDIVFCIQQTMKAGRGEPAQYPLAIRIIK